MILKTALFRLFFEAVKVSSLSIVSSTKVFRFSDKPFHRSIYIVKGFAEPIVERFRANLFILTGTSGAVSTSATYFCRPASKNYKPKVKIYTIGFAHLQYFCSRANVLLRYIESAREPPFANTISAFSIFNGLLAFRLS